MQKIALYRGNAKDVSITSDLIITDPPFEMAAKELHNIIECHKTDHLVLIATMRQIIDFMKISDWILSFDFVLDTVAPKKSKSIRQPNYTHSNGVYLHRPGAKSRFNRKLRQRSDTFEANGYWPTIFNAPRERLSDHGMAKNLDAITDLLGSFDVESVTDLFAGSGTTGLAAFELGLSCNLIELNNDHCDSIQQLFKFMGVSFADVSLSGTHA